MGLFRQEAGRLVATLTAHLDTHHLQLAEDIVQEALFRALQTWPYRGVPDNPAAWLTQIAKNLALDQLRREQRWSIKQDSIAARLSARTDDTGNLLRLHEQNRSAWDQTMIQRGIQRLGDAAKGSVMSEYHLEAGIAACHSTAPDDASTNWPRIRALYDQLLTLTTSPIASMNRAVVVARVYGPKAGLAALDSITDRSKLEANHLFHVIYGTFAAELGHQAIALTHFRQAENLASVPVERDFISRRSIEIGDKE